MSVMSVKRPLSARKTVNNSTKKTTKKSKTPKKGTKKLTEDKLSATLRTYDRSQELERSRSKSKASRDPSPNKSIRESSKSISTKGKKNKKSKSPLRMSGRNFLKVVHNLLLDLERSPRFSNEAARSKLRTFDRKAMENGTL